MSETTARTDPAFRRINRMAITLIVAGGIVVFLGIGLDWGGFVGGMALGAGVGSVIVGAYFWGYANGLRRTATRASADPASWLPSRDDHA